MKRAANILTVLLCHGAVAWGAIGTLDNVPGATLLLPYFEVGVGSGFSDEPEAATTVFTITNIDPAARLAQITLWTDLAVPTFTFNLYLTGYDTATVDLRLLFAGFIDGATFNDCNTPRSVLTAAEIEHLRRAHTGKSSARWSGSCGAIDHGDDLARGYLTVDVVSECTTLFPGDPGYFLSGGTGVASNANVLIGEYTIVDRQSNFSFAESMISLEASTDPATATSGNYTFYGRLIGWSAADNREPAAGDWWSRYLNGGVFDGGTTFLVWRDPASVVNPFSCFGEPPAPFPLSERQLVAFDEEENPSGIGDPQFPWAAMRVDTSLMPIPFSFGSMFLDLDAPTSSSGGPSSDPAARQSVVTAVFSTSGRFQTGMTALPVSGPGGN